MIKMIRNFLPEHQAEHLSNGIINTPEHWWSYAVAYNGSKGVYYFKNTILDRTNLEAHKPYIDKSFQEGHFTYKFKRSTNHVESCNCYECDFKKEYLDSEEFKGFISKETGIQNPAVYETFASVYDRGDYLSMHPDAKRGVAFIFNLTKDWLPEFGGLLNVQQEDGSYKAIVPEYNSLVLLQLGEAGTQHFVSEVSAYAPKPRIAISGWYNEGA